MRKPDGRFILEHAEGCSRKSEVQELVTLLALGGTMGTVVQLDYADDAEGQWVACHEVNMFGADAVA